MMKMILRKFNALEILKFIFFISIFSVSLLITLANVLHFYGYKNSLINSIPKINLGIDIIGGNQLIVAVDDKDFFSNKYEPFRDRVLQAINNYKIIAIGDINIDDNGIVFDTQSINAIDVVKFVSQSDSNLDYSLERQGQFIRVSMFYKNIYRDKLISEAIERSMTNIRNRIDGIGIKEIVMQKYSNDKIIIVVPFGIDIDSIKRAINTVAKLTFHLIDRHSVLFNYSPKIKVPDNKMVIGDYRLDNIFYIVNKVPQLTGDYLSDARAYNDGLKNMISFQLNDGGSKIFTQITRNNPSRMLAIALDNKVLMAPVINEPIYGGKGVITGNFTDKEVHDLALLLKSGSLPVKLSIIEEKNISNQLGKEIIGHSKYAMLLGVLSVMIFMLIRYKKLGLVADLALIFNLLFTISIMSVFGFTLTIPGIAGLILMLGMAVDANVLIYEKMHEMYYRHNIVRAHELIRHSFNGAFNAIVDSNLTTIFASFALLNFGGSFLKGFAITLIIGILCSMFTAVNLTKIMIIKTISDKNRLNFKPF